jgi:hypothetical protein
MIRRTDGWRAAGLAAATWWAAQTAWAQTGAAIQDSHAKYLNERLQRMTTELQLTDEQQAKIRAIHAEEIAATRQWTVESQPLQQEYRTAMQGKDEAARRAAQEKSRAMNERRAAISAQATTQIRAVITDAKWLAWLTSQMVDGWMKRLQAGNLTEEQKERIRTLCAESVRTQEATTNMTAKAAAYRQLSDTIQNTVLGARQREDVATDEVLQHVMRRLPDVGFTDEQKTKIKALCAEAARTARAATDTKSSGSSFRASRDVEQKVTEQVMTEAQRGAIEGARLYRLISYAFAPCEPTPEQVSRMKALCQDAAKGWTPTTDYKTRGTEAREVHETIKSTILTEAQRAKLPPPPPAARVNPAATPAPVRPPAPAAN